MAGLNSFFSIFIALLLCVPYLSNASLQNELTALFDEKAPNGSSWSVMIERKSDSDILLDVNAERPLIPASNMKLVSCGSILMLLGPDYAYETTLFRSGKQQGNLLDGDLIVRGSGDPSIGGRFNGNDLTEMFRTWAYALKQANISVLHGDIVGDDRVFNIDRAGLNWYPGDRLEWYGAEVSALNFNDGCVDLSFQGGTGTGSQPSILLNPPTKYLTIINQLKTVNSDRYERRITYNRDLEDTHVTITGAIRKNKKLIDYTSVPDPTMYFLTVFKETLEAEGIQVKGNVRRVKREDLLVEKIEWVEVAAHHSPPLRDLINVCLKRSQNLYAEHFLKTVGYHVYGEGSLLTGSLAAKDILAKHGCSLDYQYIADGSGLSRENQFGAKAFVRLLRALDESNYAQEFRDSLAVSGVSGTLKGNMRDTPAYKRVFAKTGTLTGVRALSGYIEAESGEDYIFSMLANGGSSNSLRIKMRNLMEDLCALVAEKG